MPSRRPRHRAVAPRARARTRRVQLVVVPPLPPRAVPALLRRAVAAVASAVPRAKANPLPLLASQAKTVDDEYALVAEKLAGAKAAWDSKKQAQARLWEREIDRAEFSMGRVTTMNGEPPSFHATRPFMIPVGRGDACLITVILRL